MALLDESVKLAAAEAYLETVCANPYDVHGDGSVWVRCNSRLASKCPACSKLFQNDWAAICRSGIFDADGQTLTGYTWALVTLTAPSFGQVHRVPHRMRDKPVTCACGLVHEFRANVAGEPVAPEQYDYDGALLFNQSLGRLWNNTVTRWRRAFGKDFQYFAVTEAQKRGAMHKHVLVRYPRGSILPQEFLALAAASYTVAWTGDVIQWGKQSDVQTLDPMDNPDEAARAARYLVKMTSYAVKQVDAATERVSRAAERLLMYAAYDYRCSPECDRPDGGSVCDHPIHSDLVGSERVLSQSKGWSLSGTTRTGLREARRVYADAMRESDDGVPHDEPEGMSAADLYASRLVRKYRVQMAKLREEKLRQQWEQMQEEREATDEHEHERMRT